MIVGGLLFGVFGKNLFEVICMIFYDFFFGDFVSYFCL